MDFKEAWQIVNEELIRLNKEKGAITFFIQPFTNEAGVDNPEGLTKSFHFTIQYLEDGEYKTVAIGEKPWKENIIFESLGL